MKRYVYIIAMIISQQILLGQSCLSGGISFTTQQQIDDFSTNYPNCTEIEGNILINDSSNGGITNLNGLSQLTSLGGNIKIVNNNSLINLTGLDNIQSITGELRIGEWNNGNNSINSLTGLENLTTVGGNVAIYNNPQLQNMTGLNSLTSIGGNLWAWNNNNLANLTGLDVLASIGIDIGFGNNVNLSSLNGLQALTTLGAILYIKNNDALINFTGLDNLNTIGSYIYINDNYALTSLDGLENVTSIGGEIVIAQNYSLADISGIKNIEANTIDNQSGTDLHITGSPSLSVCHYQNICDVVNDPDKTVIINSNMTGCNSESEVETACLTPLPINLISFSGEKRGNAINLQWQTTSEINNDYFIVEHSTNGDIFSSIGKIQGNETNFYINEYHFVHKYPSSGLIYYRLKQIDFDGKHSYSDVISVRLDNMQTTFFPNPAKNTLYFNNPVELVAIYNMLGEEVLLKKNISNSVDISGLSSGTYLIILNNIDRKILAIE